MIDREAARAAVEDLLRAVGEDPDRPGLRDTPTRVAAAYEELLSGTRVDPATVLEPLRGETGSGLILASSIPFVSICEHHLMAFHGTAAVAYLPGPDGRITGLSKLARLIEVLSRRLQVQERLVRDAADAIEKALEPKGVWIHVEAEHLCMRARGARTHDARIVTTDARGVFAEDAAARTEVLALARSSA